MAGQMVVKKVYCWAVLTVYWLVGHLDDQMAVPTDAQTVVLMVYSMVALSAAWTVEQWD